MGLNDIFKYLHGFSIDSKYIVYLSLSVLVNHVSIVTLQTYSNHNWNNICAFRHSMVVTEEQF